MRALVIALLLAACAAGPGRSQPGYVAVLAGGDDSLPVFDNATARMANLLAGAGVVDIHRFSATAGVPGAGLSLRGRILDAVAALHPAPGQACFVFMTSHGAHGPGLYLAPRDEFLSPADLAHALSKGCGTAPTVAIMSACYTGNFARPPVAQPNRVVLTAARADRPSFGCGAGRTYTVFDACLLDALAQHPPAWPAVSDVTNACVSQAEAEDDEVPSEPQSYFGAATHTLAPPG